MVKIGGFSPNFSAGQADLQVSAHKISIRLVEMQDEFVLFETESRLIPKSISAHYSKKMGVLTVTTKTAVSNI